MMLIKDFILKKVHWIQYKFSSGQRVVLVLGLCFAIALIILMGLAAWLISDTNENYKDILGQSLAEQVAINGTDMIISNDQLSLNILIRNIIADFPVAKVSVYTIDNKRLAWAKKPDISQELNYHKYSEATVDENVISGYVHLQLDEPKLDYTSKQNIIIFAAVNLSLFLLAGYFFVGYYLSQPVAPVLDEVSASSYVKSDENLDVFASASSQLNAGVDNSIKQNNTTMAPEAPAFVPVSTNKHKPDKRMSILVILYDQPLLKIAPKLDEAIPCLNDILRYYAGRISYSSYGLLQIHFNSSIKQNDNTNVMVELNSIRVALAVQRVLLDPDFRCSLDASCLSVGVSLFVPVSDKYESNVELKIATNRAMALADLKNESLIVVDDLLGKTEGCTFRPYKDDSQAFYFIKLAKHYEKLFDRYLTLLKNKLR